MLFRRFVVFLAGVMMLLAIVPGIFFASTISQQFFGPFFGAETMIGDVFTRERNLPAIICFGIITTIIVGGLLAVGIIAIKKSFEKNKYFEFDHTNGMKKLMEICDPIIKMHSGDSEPAVKQKIGKISMEQTGGGEQFRVYVSWEDDRCLEMLIPAVYTAVKYGNVSIPTIAVYEGKFRKMKSFMNKRKQIGTWSHDIYILTIPPGTEKQFIF